MLYVSANTSRQPGEYSRYSYGDTMASDKKMQKKWFFYDGKQTNHADSNHWRAEGWINTTYLIVFIKNKHRYMYKYLYHISFPTTKLYRFIHPFLWNTYSLLPMPVIYLNLISSFQILIIISLMTFNIVYRLSPFCPLHYFKLVLFVTLSSLQWLKLILFYITRCVFVHHAGML